MGPPTTFATPHADAPPARTRADWCLWLKQQEALFQEEYERHPDRLISDANGERNFVRDYHSRELLELLQNANDAAAKAGIRGKMRIELSALGLVAANTGAIFSQAGVASLLLPHTSSKPTEGTPAVGHKGLGFRSLLNWTKTPLILSGELAVAFSAEHAMRKQAELVARSAALAEVITQHQPLVGQQVVPLLVFPGFSQDADLSGFVRREQRELLERMQSLRADGYDTVIGVPFLAAGAHAAATEQIRVLEPEILLFARHLEELIVSVDGQPALHWRSDPVGADMHRVQIGEPPSETREWKLFSRSDLVPREFVPEDQVKLPRYEVVLARPLNHPAKSGFLYSYFPTEVRFPYPIVCHATLDLISNRQQLQDTAANRFVLGVLADLLADVAEQLARAQTSFAGLEVLNGLTSSDPLEKFEFGKRLTAAAREKRLIPTLGGNLSRAIEARAFFIEDTTWFPRRAFGHVARLTHEHPFAVLLARLGVAIFSDADWAAALAKLSFTSIQQRAAFIAGMIRQGYGEKLSTVSVLIDTSGRPVSVGSRVFLPHADSERVAVPPRFRIRFIDATLAKQLGQALGRSDQEGLAQLLTPLHVSRYSLDSVATALAATTNRRAEQNPKNESALRRELLAALFSLFPLKQAPADRPKFPPDALVRLPTLAKSFEDARILYLSSDYSERGRLLQSLFGGFTPESLVAGPTELGIAAPVSEVIEFLKWIRVADLPRAETIGSPGPEFRQHALANLDFPLRMDDQTFDFAGQLGTVVWRDLVTVEYLDEILTHADPGAVLAWLAIDPRAAEWKAPSVQHGKIGSQKSRQYARWAERPVASYVRWRTQTQPWLPIPGGKKVPPQTTLADPMRGLEEHFPPALRPTPKQLSDYGVHANRTLDALDRAGVVPSFSELPPARIYAVLTQLPTNDAKGEKARSIYSAILDHYDAAQLSGSVARDRFKQKGTMWGRCGREEKYVAVAELWHVDSEDIPAALTDKLWLVAIPKRSGAPRVTQIFGVRALTRDLVRREVTHHVPIAEAVAFSDEIERLKPLIRRLRKRARETTAFRQLRIVVCSEISGVMEFQGQTTPLELAPWDWVLDDQKTTAYVRCDPSEPSPTGSSLLADAVGQIFAAIFNIERGDDIARLVTCPPRDRPRILRRLSGDDTIPDLEQLEQAYRQTKEPESDDAFHLPSDSFAPPTITPPADSPPLPPPPPSAPPPPPPTAGPVVIESVPHLPTPPKKVGLRVTRRISAGPRCYSWSNRVTNGDLCEFKAMEFEVTDEQPRYPLRVGQIKGWQAPGVDILSFATEANREQFLAGDHRDALVARFIEVKGRSAGGARIDLKGNEFEAARKYRNRYYIYRLFDRGDGAFELAILQNPLEDRTGAHPCCEINFEASTGAVDYNLTGGVNLVTLADALSRDCPVPVSRNPKK